MENQLRKDSTQKEAKLEKNTKRQQIDLSGCKLVAPYGKDPHTLESLSSIATKLGIPKVGTIKPKRAVTHRS